MNIKAIIAVSAIALGFASFVGVSRLSAAPEAPAAPHVVTIPEVTIMGEARSNVVEVPEVLIVGDGALTPRARKGASKGPNVTRVRTHELHQGGRPGAVSVKVIN